MAYSDNICRFLSFTTSAIKRIRRRLLLSSATARDDIEKKLVSFNSDLVSKWHLMTRRHRYLRFVPFNKL